MLVAARAESATAQITSSKSDFFMEVMGHGRKAWSRCKSQLVEEVCPRIGGCNDSAIATVPDVDLFADAVFSANTERGRISATGILDNEVATYSAIGQEADVVFITIVPFD